MSDETIGNYETEKQAAEAFDALIDDADWQMEKEVCGFLQQPRPFCAPDGLLRIDRILIPKPRLQARGWKLGAVGIELKKSGVNLAPVVAQVMDYQRCAWKLDSGIGVWISHSFIWRCGCVQGSLASVMAQHQIGCANESPAWMDEKTGLRLWYNNQIIYNCGAVQSTIRGGKKVGSR